MCLAYPGKIERILGQQAEVNFDGLTKTVNISLVQAEVGDYVIVHAGFAIEKLQFNEARETLKLLKSAK